MYIILKLCCFDCKKFYDLFIFNGNYKDIKYFIYDLSDDYYDYYYLIFDNNGNKIDEVCFDETDLI